MIPPLSSIHSPGRSHADDHVRSDGDEAGRRGQRHAALPPPVLAGRRAHSGHRVAPPEAHQQAEGGESRGPTEHTHTHTHTH